MEKWNILLLIIGIGFILLAVSAIIFDIHRGGNALAAIGTIGVILFCILITVNEVRKKKDKSTGNYLFSFSNWQRVVIVFLGVAAVGTGLLEIGRAFGDGANVFSHIFGGVIFIVGSLVLFSLAIEKEAEE